MPYVKKDKLKNLLRGAFMAGVMAGIDIEHEFYSPTQDDERFEEYYRRFLNNQR